MGYMLSVLIAQQIFRGLYCFPDLVSMPVKPLLVLKQARRAGWLLVVFFFPADAKQFQKIAQDCADSRFYAGIHFRTDNETGLTMGRKLGKYIVETWMKE